MFSPYVFITDLSCDPLNNCYILTSDRLDQVSDFSVNRTVPSSWDPEFRVPRNWVQDFIMSPATSRSMFPSHIYGTGIVGSRGPCPGCRPLLTTDCQHLTFLSKWPKKSAELPITADRALWSKIDVYKYTKTGKLRRIWCSRKTFYWAERGKDWIKFFIHITWKMPRERNWPGKVFNI